MITKLCKKCNKDKELDEFHRDKTKKYRRKDICKDCRRLVEYPKRKKYNKIYYKKNKEESKKLFKKWYEENKEYRKRYEKDYLKSFSNYNTYASQISFCEEIRRNPENEDYLQVKCTNSSCRKWFSPTVISTKERIRSLNSLDNGECNLYCSDECKQECSIYNKSKFRKGEENYKNRDPQLQQEWAEMVKERDNYTCQRCGRKDLPLVAHHIEGLNINPIMSADIDLGITLCSKCDKLVHSEKGCRPTDLRKERLCK